jgi:hypothetical protein
VILRYRVLSYRVLSYRVLSGVSLATLYGRFSRFSGFSVSSTRVKILGRRKTGWGESSC